jgi:hypothetical protein
VIQDTDRKHEHLLLPGHYSSLSPTTACLCTFPLSHIHSVSHVDTQAWLPNTHYLFPRPKTITRTIGTIRIITYYSFVLYVYIIRNLQCNTHNYCTFKVRYITSHSTYDKLHIIRTIRIFVSLAYYSRQFSMLGSYPHDQTQASCVHS